MSTVNESHFLNFERQFVTYGKCHTNRINIVCHTVCVPLLLWTALVLTLHFEPIFSKTLNGWELVLDWPWILIGIYTLFYLLLEPLAATFFLPVLSGLAYYAIRFAHSFPNFSQVALVLHLSCWALLFFTYIVFEKKTPALVDNFSQALLFAPFFVFFEILFALGYRPLLQKRMTDEIGQALHEYQKLHRN
ncbi:DUF962-domain-containing protein [Basidiobolus meristosporus CBS 931.73]|uniref:DUF962-domain-containing protein n=1 Tax=Basidiobolus meristosporus CBS 931.73 TaxID=1314790 RepID=A0A1Y1YU44_9FUNG|nr:DUF962-domain-containing protein [Basidiobolus meristosporus CBS 931.73]|eukprot:ORY01531.1 DUF962-domain-containing protein [Basidiobolus meristosporus CBS 931.73]